MNTRNAIAAGYPVQEAALCRQWGGGQGFMPPRALKVGLIVLLWTACTTMALYASNLDPLVITMVESSGNTYFEPANRRIAIRSLPVRLFIRIRNTSEAAQLIRAHPEKAYAIELTDPAGLMVMVKRKIKTDAEAGEEVLVNLSPGADTIVPMHISRDTWEGVPSLTVGKESRYEARVVYETADGKHVYSEPYTLVFNVME